METNRHLRRRELIAGLGGLGLAAWPVSRAVAALTGPGTVDPVAEAAVSCVLAPEQTEGPYWIPNRLTRRRITEGRPGVPLALSLTVLNATTCRPIRGADVEVWHCDAGGVYSGVGSAASRRFLRGHQRADAAGRVRFDTIYPGWYRGRTTHIHVKVHVGGNVVHTGQLYFPDAVTNAVYRRTPYRSHGTRDTTNARDGIYGQGGRRSTLRLARHPRDSGYTGSLALGVRA
jgi:protocatechuate 3,4-dioxygenase beta subunit